MVSRMLAAAPASEVSATRLFARLNDEFRATRACGRAADADDRRGRGARADRGARLQARAVLSAAEFRNASARSRRHAARHGGARADRRLGRSRARAWCRPSCWRWAARPICARCSQPGEPVVLMGPTGTPTEIAGGRNRAAGRRRARQRRAVLDRPGVARDGRRCCTSPATRSDRPLQGRRDRARRRRGGLVLRRGAGLRRRAAAGPGVRRQHRAGAWTPTASGALGEPADPARRCRSRDRHRLGRHDGGGRRARGTASWRRYLKPGHRRSRSINSPMQCMMKEICAQCLQPHRDPETGKSATCSPASTRTSPSTTSTSAACAPGSAERRAGKAHARVDRPLAAKTGIATDRGGMRCRPN